MKAERKIPWKYKTEVILYVAKKKKKYLKKNLKESKEKKKGKGLEK